MSDRSGVITALIVSALPAMIFIFMAALMFFAGDADNAKRYAMLFIAGVVVAGLTALALKRGEYL